MVVFGGTTDPSVNPYGATVPGSNDLWVWSTTLRTWSQPTTQFAQSSNNAPAPQKFLNSVALQSQGKMMSLVANNTPGASAGNLLMLDTNFWSWSIPNSPNPAVAPPYRVGAAVGTSDSLIFVHGGASIGSNGQPSSGVLNDLTKLDESTFSWTSIANGPSLMYHTMCKLSGLNTMVIFGGSDQSTTAFNTIHTFDLNLEVWRLAIPVSSGTGGGIPSARKGHTAVCLNNTMIVYGGGSDSPLDDDVWVLDATNVQWTWNRITTNNKLGPGARAGHSALLNGTNMLVWGGWGTPVQGDVNLYILDTLTWQWSSSKDVPTSYVPPPVAPGTEPDTKKQNLPLTIGVVCASLALIAAFVGFLLLKRRATRRKQNDAKDSHGTTSFLTDGEQNFLARDLATEEDKPSYYRHGDRDSGSSIGRRSHTNTRQSSPLPSPQHPQGYPMQSMAAFAQSAAEQDSSKAESSRSSDLYRQPYHPSMREDQTIGAVKGTRVDSVSSDPFYPAYLAEDDEEDADRWTFASSLSFDQRENHQSLPTLRYIPGRMHGAGSTQRSMGHSTGSLGATNAQRIPISIHTHVGSRATRRDPSGISVLSGNGSSIGPGSISLSQSQSNTAEVLTRESSSSPRENTLFNSVSPLDMVTLMCSGMDVDHASDEDAMLLNHRNSGSIQLHGKEELTKENQEPTGVTTFDLRRKDTTSTSTTQSSTTYTTLDHPALVNLVQNIPARYKLSKSPLPIHGEVNDILFAVDADTQQPIAIKSFARKEAWERECRTLRRLRGPCVVELKHVATLVLSETDEPGKPAKVRLTILERLDETLAQMLKNARKAKKVALRERAPPNESLDLAGPGLYSSGPALDEGYIRDISKGVLRCLTWCHSKKIVYCDLKPSNVMHNRDDPRQQWKLIDLESSRTAAEECIGIGTVRYCPPEVARGTTIDKEASSGVTAQFSIDLWAFGCLLYELFATRPLFPLSLSDDTVLHFLAHPSPDTPTLARGLRWNEKRELVIPHFEQAVPDDNARRLIRSLLHPDPLRRATMTQVLNSEYLNIGRTNRNSNPQAPTYFEGNRPVSSRSNFSQPRAPQTQTAGASPDMSSAVLGISPCLLVPLPNLDDDKASWKTPSQWDGHSFRLHYLCQHGVLDSEHHQLHADAHQSGGHFVQQTGYVVANPVELFQALGPLLVLSLDLQASKNVNNQCPPGYEEQLQQFERTCNKGETWRGFTGYCHWIKEQILQLGASPKDIPVSLQELQDVVDPNKSYAGMHRISHSGATILVCALHLESPEYKNWARN
ncbi:F-box only protein 42 [Podila humilis]|nr:F-box only protein 42 [Podila humilis]